MKRYLRYLACLLCICITIVSLSSCLTVVRFYDELEYMAGEHFDGEESRENDQGGQEQGGTITEDLPLDYTLTEADREEFDRLLTLCRTLTLAGTDEEAIDDAWERLEDHYYHVATQSQIAYILYCYDQSNEELSDAYLFASEMASELYADYMSLCQEIDTSNSPYRDAFFSDWTEEELEEMRAYSEELSALYDENDRMLVEFRELEDADFDDRAAELYYRTVLNNNRIAKLKGYEDYYKYAYDKVYLRDYSAESSAQLHSLCSEHLIPLYSKALVSFQTNYQTLNSLEKSFLSSFLYSDYDEMTVNYVSEYISTVPKSMKSSMQTMFEKGNSLFTDSEDSHAGAFTAMLYEYEKPFCYFGPGYQSSSTVVHELGHYYAEQFHIDDDLAMDLAEVHSQGNEMLFLVFLEDHISQRIYDCLVNYVLLDALTTIIVCMTVDAFEMQVYANADQITNPAEDLDKIMKEVLGLYGGEEFFTENIADPYKYWRYVTIESPVYYISYAVSGIAAIELYAEATEDYAAATEAYQKLVEDIAPSQGFLAALQEAGLGNPFSTATYQKIKLAFERN